MPFSASTWYTATEHVKIAGCVFAVSFNSSSVPAKHISEMEKPSALSASSKTARAVGYFSASSFPMPGYCDACPGNINATLPIVLTSLAPSCACPRSIEVRGRGREFLFDFFVHARARESCGHANRVLHCVGVRAPMPDHAYSAHSQ